MPLKKQLIDKDQIRGAVTDVAGEKQRQTGKLVGSTDEQVKGGPKQTNDNVQTLTGDVKEVLKDAKKK